MKHPHIAFITAPIAACVNPVLPLVSTLVRRGYRVTCATSEPFISRAARAGAQVVEYEFGALTAKGLHQQTYCQLATSTLAAVERFYESSPPDLVAYEFVALAGRILANRLQVPAIKTSSNFAYHRDYLVEQITSARQRERAVALSAAADTFLQANGVRSEGFLYHLEPLNLFFFPREFEPSADALDPSCLHLGRCAGEQVGFGEWRRPESWDGPIILVAPSRSYARGLEYYRMCISALAGLPYHVVLSIDDSEDAAALDPLPDNFEVVQKTSHTKILPHADLVVGMAGTTTSSEALYHGVPLIMTSCGALELEWVAGNLMRLGIGLHIRNADMSAGQIRNAVAQVLGSSLIRSNVRKLQRSIRRQPGAEEAANQIEEFIASSCGVTSSMCEATGS